MAETGSGGSDPDVAKYGQVEAGAESGTVDRSNEGFREIYERPMYVPRGFVDLLTDGRIARLHLITVETGTEAVSFAGQDGHFDVVIHLKLEQSALDGNKHGRISALRRAGRDNVRWATAASISTRSK